MFLFSGLAINAVTRAAGAIVFEVRRQFREIPGIMEGTTKPEYGKVVDICTRDSLRELTTPGLLAALSPVIIGFGLGIGALAGFLAGAIGTGCLMAVFLANSGGAWDNAKKIVEDGTHGGKGSPAHEATVIGDTVGDPFKDTAGPAINPLLKVMNLVAVLIAPAIVMLSVGEDASGPIRYGIAGVGLVIVVTAVAISKRRDLAIGGDDEGEPVAEYDDEAPDSGAITAPGEAVDEAVEGSRLRPALTSPRPALDGMVAEPRTQEASTRHTPSAVNGGRPTRQGEPAAVFVRGWRQPRRSWCAAQPWERGWSRCARLVPAAGPLWMTPRPIPPKLPRSGMRSDLPRPSTRPLLRLAADVRRLGHDPKRRTPRVSPDGRGCAMASSRARPPGAASHPNNAMLRSSMRPPCA